MGKIANKWALVTGSSRGIGQQIAIGLAQEGCNVIIHARKKENTEKTVNLIKEYGVKFDVVEGDLSKTDELHKMVEVVKEKHGGVDILYNNAAIMSEWKEFWDITVEDFNVIFQNNLYSVLLLSQAFAPKMKENGYGRIINITSGIKDTPQLSPYGVSKAAVDKLTQDLAVELKGTGVLANCLDPGWLKTDLGGPNADYEVETVLPGAIKLALFDNDGPTGGWFGAQDYRS
ncbi:SDR family oxidoreductase [Bacillus spongiae]|uniref:SDR family oxidoreductase n=1 Tax=Bacillus spongiae TaxID=2683610 RepID=A0ABU8HAV1_9BACI